MGSGGGYEAAYGDITNLQNSWTAEETKIRSMAARLQSMLSEISAAANKEISKDSAASRTGHNAAQSAQEQEKAQEITRLLKTATEDVNRALTAVNALSRQLSEDAGKLGETARTYELAELAAKDHITSAAQLASYNGPDAGKIRSLLNGQSRQGAWNTDQTAAGLASPGGAPGGGSEYAGAGAGSGAGAGGGGYAGATGGGTGGGTGTPVAPNQVASSAQVDQWVKEAIKELEKEGIPASKIDPNAIKLIIEHESGGNPSIVNNWDSNAAAGHPSEGLMQTIAPTFQQYASPGHGNILNPVDNIMAGCKYAIARYGSLDNVPGVIAVEHGGSYVGY